MTTRHGLKEPLDHPKYGDLDDLFDILGNSPEIAGQKRALIREAYAHRRHQKDRQKIYANAIAAGVAEPDVFARRKILAEQMNDRSRRILASELKEAFVEKRNALDKVARRVEKAKIGMIARAKKASPDRPKFPRKLVMRTPQKDKHYIEIVGKDNRDGYAPKDALVYSHLRENPNLRDYTLSPWDKASFIQKVAASSYCADTDGGYTINVNLNPEKIEAALTSSKGPIAYITDRVTKALKSEFGTDPEFVLVIEASQTTRTKAPAFHLHGIVCPPSVPNVTDRLETAFRRAVGDWDAPTMDFFQMQFDPIDRPIGWASYILKQLNSSVRSLSDAYPDMTIAKLCSISRAMTRKVKSRWGEFRDNMPEPGRKRKRT